MIWPYIILSYLALFTYGLCDNMRGPIFPELIRNFQVSHVYGSWFYAMNSVFALTGSWATLHTLKKLDRIQNLYVALLILSLGLTIISSGTEFWHLLVGSGITGFGFGQTTVCYNILSTVGTSPARRQGIVSGLHSMYALSSFIAPLVVAGVYRIGFDWRAGFTIGAVLCAALAIFGFFFIRKENKSLETRVSGESSDQVIKEATIHEKPGGLYIIAPAFAFYVVGEILIASRLALFLRNEKGFDLAGSSFYVTGFFLCLLISRLFFSFFHPKIKVHKQLLMFLSISLVMMILGIAVNEIFLVALGITMGPFYALSVIYLSEVFPKTLNKAVALSMANQSMFVLFMHVGSGWLTDQIGIGRTMWMGPVCLLTSLVLLWGFPKWKRLT